MNFSCPTGRTTSPVSCPVVVSTLRILVAFVILTSTDTNEDGDHRYMMFSATFNKSCRQLARKFLAEDHVRVRIGRPGSAHINVDQKVSP